MGLCCYLITCVWSSYFIFCTSSIRMDSPGEASKCDKIGCKCDKCGRTYVTKKSLNAHKCTGHLPLQCGICMQLFKDRHEKYRHSLLQTCGEVSLDDRPTRATGSSRVEGDLNNVNNVNTNNGAINNNIFNISLLINNFSETDCQLAIDAISKNPAFIQVADEHNLLTEAIIDETHFSGDPKNRNVFGSDKNGKYMTVVVNGKRGVVNKKVALAQSIREVEYIKNDLIGKDILTEREEKIENMTEFQRQKCQKNRHDQVYYSKGDYSKPPTLVVPETPPMYVTDAEIKEMFLRIMSSIENPHHQDPIMYKELAMNALTEYTFVGNRWFKARGEGWEVCKDETGIYRHVYLLLNDMKNSLRPEIKSIFSSPDDVAQAHRILDYFPDRKIADHAVNWLKEGEVPSPLPPSWCSSTEEDSLETDDLGRLNMSVSDWTMEEMEKAGRRY